MNVLLVIRSEILAIFILLFLIVYDLACAKYREGKDLFLGFALTSLGHVVMGLITEITVNSTTVSTTLNDIFHILFFTFALLFSLQYFRYSLSLVVSRKKVISFIIPACVLSLASIIIMMASKIDYLTGNGTKYSAGTGPTMCYMLGFILFLLSDIILICEHKKINKHIYLTILPISFISLGFLAVQIVVPEFLFTGAAISIQALGVFFTIENPIGKFSNRALIDLNTGIYNRNCYERDLSTKIKNLAFSNEHRVAIAIGDIDGLKNINDKYGHMQGDKLIEAGAKIISKEFKHAYRVYRIGGDEYAAFFIDVEDSIIKNEIENAVSGCHTFNESNNMGHLSLSIGFAVHREGEPLETTANRADKLMYDYKEYHYKANQVEPKVEH